MCLLVSLLLVIWFNHQHFKQENNKPGATGQLPCITAPVQVHIRVFVFEWTRVLA